MSGDASAFGFGKFIPGFDFLQGLAQSTGAAASPLGRVPQWVAPTVSVEEVDKRIAELKAVQFWLEQNGRALTATIQALEVQRMTLSTLKDMNVSMSELAKSFQFPAAAQAEASAAAHAGWPMGAAAAAEPAEPVQEPPKEQPQQQKPQTDAKPEAEPAAQAEPSAQALGQAMQWWGALTQQFQQIAAKAMAEPLPAETMAAAQRATEVASGFAQSAMEKMMAQAGSFGGGKEAAASEPAGEPKPVRKASSAKASSSKAATAKSVTPKSAAAKRPAAKKPVPKKAPAKTAAASRKS